MPSFLKKFLHIDYSVLTNRAYLLATLIRSSTGFMRQARVVVMGWFVYDATGNSFQLALLAMAELLPFILCTFFNGYIADRFGRKKPTFLHIAGTFLLTAWLCYLVAQPVTHAVLMSIYACCALFGVLRGLFAGGMIQSLISLLVPRAQTQKAVAWDGIFSQSAFILGPIVGGLVYHAYGVVWANAVVLTMAGIVLIAVCFMKDVIVHHESEKLDSQWKKMTAGFRFIFSLPILKATVLLDFFAVILSGVTGLLPVFVKDILHMGPDDLGYLRASIAVGSLMAGFFLAHSSLRGHVGRQFLIGVAAFGVCLLMFSQSTSFYLSMMLLFLSGCFDWYAALIRMSLVRLVTPDNLHGRVASARAFFANSANEINNFQSATLASIIGPVGAVVVGGLGALLLVAVTAWKTPSLRHVTMEKLIEDNR